MDTIIFDMSLFHHLMPLMPYWIQFTPRTIPYKFATSNLTVKQQTRLKSPIKDINECLNKIISCFNPTHSLFSSGLRVVNHFSNKITFHSSLFSSDEDLFTHIQNLNHVFRQWQTSSHSAAIITNGNVKKSNMASVIAYLWVSQMVTYLVCDRLKYGFKVLMSRVRQATKNVVKSEV